MDIDQTIEFEKWLYSHTDTAYWRSKSPEYRAAKAAWEARDAELAELQSLANTRGQNCVVLTLELDSARERIKSLESCEVVAAEKLARAIEWIESAPHGDNCFVSDHYEGDPGNRCNCGKDSIVEYLNESQPQPLTSGKPKTLLYFGYAPGEYSSTCLHCKQRMEDVDKRCHCCKPCAERLLTQSQPLAGEPT